jgi:hypothetical protein
MNVRVVLLCQVRREIWIYFLKQMNKIKLNLHISLITCNFPITKFKVNILFCFHFMSKFTSLDTYHPLINNMRGCVSMRACSHSRTHARTKWNRITLHVFRVANRGHIMDFETNVQKRLASMQCSINAMPRVTRTTFEFLARLQHCTGSNQGTSGPTFLSGNFE